MDDHDRILYKYFYQEYNYRYIQDHIVYMHVNMHWIYIGIYHQEYFYYELQQFMKIDF